MRLLQFLKAWRKKRREWRKWKEEEDHFARCDAQVRLGIGSRLRTTGSVTIFLPPLAPKETPEKWWKQRQKERT